MKLNLPALGLLVLTVAAVHVPAQVNPYKDGTPGVTGYRSEVLSEVIGQENKFTRLAEAIPAEKYSWRPSPDVRSFAEVFLHVSAANYNLYTLVGAKVPEGLDVKGLEKSTTDKAKVIATLKDSFVHAKKSDHGDAGRRPREKPGLVWWKEYRARRSAFYRAPRRRASGAVDRLRAFSSESLHPGPKTPRKKQRRRQLRKRKRPQTKQ